MIVGLCGRAGVGKSTAAHALVERGFEHRPFARPLKAMLETLLLEAGASWGETIDAMGRDKELPCRFLAGVTPRRAMQTLGTEWGRALDPEFWTKQWAAGLTPGADAVADDVRFPNEADAIRRLGGIVVRIDGIARRPAPAAMAAHASETGQFAADMIVVNDGSPPDLAERLAAALGARGSYKKREAELSN